MLKRRKIAITAVLLMILYCMLFSGLTSYADEATNDPIITEAGELTIVATRNDFKIPSVVNGITVKKIVKVYALTGITVTSVEIPDTVQEIGNGAFQDTKNSITDGYISLETIKIPSTVRIIGDYAFSDNKIAELTIPASVKKIGQAAFSKNSIETLKFLGTVDEMGDSVFASNMIKNVELPNKLKVVPSTLFADNKLESVIIPDGVEEIGYCAFASNKNNLTDVKVPSSVKKIENYAFGGVNKIKSTTILNAKAEIGEKCFYTGITNNNASSNIPNIEKLYGYKWSTTEEYATKNNIPFEPLTDIEIKGIKYKIDYNTKKLTITGITSKADIEKNYPYGLSISETVDIGNEKCTVSAIADEALKDLPVKKILMPDTIETIGKKAFANNKITEMVLSEKLSSIGDNAFENCTQLDWIYIPKSVKTIGQSLFQNNTIVKVYCYSDSVAKTSAENAGRPIYEVDKPYPGEGTGDFAANGICYQLNKTDKTAVATGMKDEITRKILGNLKDVVIPKQIRVGYQRYEVTGVGANAINDKLIETVTIEDGVKQIGLKAFKGCSNLKKIDIPSSITYLDIQAFEDCDSLQEQEINIAEGGDYIYEDSILYRRDESGDYSRLCGWLLPCNDVTDFETYKYSSIESRAFSNCKALKSVRISEMLSNISNDAFEGIKEQVVIIGMQDSPAYVYADKHGIKFECLGFSYFNEDPFWGKYSYNFTNSAEHFLHGYYIGFLRHYVADSVFDRADGYYGEWEGACFGMAATAKLFYDGLLTPSLWDYRTGSYEEDIIDYKVFDLKEPSLNSRLEYLINFYQIFNWQLDDKEGSGAVFKPIVRNANAEGLLRELSEGTENSYLCMLGYNHTVLILDKPQLLSEEFKKEHGSEFSEYKYRIEIYNPDSLYREYIYIKEDLETMTIGDISTVNKYNNTYMIANLYWVDTDNVWTVESLIEDNRKICFTPGEASIWIKMTEPGKVDLFLINFGDITVNDPIPYSKYFIIDNYEREDMNYYTEKVGHPMQSNSNIKNETEGYSITEVRVKDDGIYKVENEDKTKPLDVDILYKDSYMRVKTGAGGTAIFENKKSVTITNPSGEDFEARLTLNEEFVTLPWYAVNVSGKDATELKIEMTEDGAVVSGDNLKDITVKASNTDETVELNVSTKRNTVLIKSNTDETKLVAYIDKDGDGDFETPLEFIEEQNLAVDDEDENSDEENNEDENSTDEKNEGENYTEENSEEENVNEENIQKEEKENSQESEEDKPSIAKSTKIVKNVQTGDNMLFVISVLVLAVVSMAIVELKYKRNNKIKF